MISSIVCLSLRDKYLLAVWAWENIICHTPKHSLHRRLQEVLLQRPATGASTRLLKAPELDTEAETRRDRTTMFGGPTSPNVS